MSPTPSKINWGKVDYVFGVCVLYQRRSRSETAQKGIIAMAPFVGGTSP